MITTTTTTLLLPLFFAFFACIVFQEIRIRKTQNYLVILLSAIAIIHVISTSSNLLNMGLFLVVVTLMLGGVRLSGIFKTSDWLCTSALFAFLIPFGIHVAVFSLALGFFSSILNHLVVCIASNSTSRDPFKDVVAPKTTKMIARISCKRRGFFDRFAYPAVIKNDDGTFAFDILYGMKGKKMDLEKKCPYVQPSIPVLTHMMCVAVFLIVMFILPQNFSL